MSHTVPTVVLRNQAGDGWLSFRRPRKTFIARQPVDVIPLLQDIEKAVSAGGFYAAGFLSYEAAPAFDASLTVQPDNTPFPLAWFALFDRPPDEITLPACASPALGQLTWQPLINPDEYRAAIARIKKHIRKGDTYQVNFTYRLRAACAADPWQLFLAMAVHEPPFGAFINAGDWAVCSASPELFFKLEGNRLESRPMKGTAARGLWHEQDLEKAAALAASEKDRAENLMITDMVRHDMGRVAVTGSVRAKKLFAVERFSTVWQMTSTVRAATRAGITEICTALFPPASITGAPKTRTMELISGLESSPRRIYTGAIGFIAPGRRAQFSVAIRTLLVNRHDEQAEYGVGGGIVWDSRPESELEESRIKARVLNPPPPAFDLLETILWRPGRGFWLLPYHIRRLLDSAAYFSYRVDVKKVRKELAEYAAALPKEPHRLRLLVGKNGAVSLMAARLKPAGLTFSDIVLAAQPVDSANPFLYHKTTCRKAYEEALKLVPGAADVLLYNEKGEITESTIANIAVDLSGRLCTPPLRCGLLPGTLRAYLLKRGELVEKPVTIAQLLSGRKVFLLNSVRGMHQVQVLHPQDTGGKKSDSSYR